MIKLHGKKAMSEIVGYVLLIIIAVALSMIVFTFMQRSLPKDVEECPSDVSVIIKDFGCSNLVDSLPDADKNNLTLVLENRGLHNIAGVIVKGESNKDLVPVRNMELYSKETGYGIAPGGKLSVSLNTTGIDNLACVSGNEITVLVEPFVLAKKGGVTYCGDSIIMQRLVLKDYVV